jgi:hypothetical protein
MNRIAVWSSAIVLIGLSGPALAQTVSCDEVQWKSEVLGAFPNIAKACQEVVVKDGKRYIRVEGTVKRMVGDTATIRLAGTNDEITISPKTNSFFTATNDKISGKDVAVGQNLRFYIPEERIAVVPSMDEPAVTEIPVVAAPAPAPAPVEAAAAPAAEALPKTASPLPLVGLLGFGFLALGGMFSALRRR